MKHIRIHSFVNDNSLAYFRYAVENYRRMASDRGRLSFVAYAFTRSTAHQLKAQDEVDRVVEVYRLPQYFVKRSLRDHLKAALTHVGIYRPMGGSNGHAAGLHAALHSTGGEAIDIIADSDTVMLKRGWDALVEELIQDFGILGASYEQIGGFSSGHGKVQTYKNLPSMTWLALSPRFDFTKLDPDPDKRRDLAIDTEELSHLYHLPIGYQLVRDVGWRLPAYLNDHNIPYAVFDQVKPTSAAAQAVHSGNDYHEEYQWHGVPVLAHQRGSHRHAFRQGPISTSFYDACERYIDATPAG